MKEQTSEMLDHFPENTQLICADNTQTFPLLLFPENLAWDLAVEDTHPAPWSSVILSFRPLCD